MKNRTLKDWSAIDSNFKVKDVLKEMVDYVMDQEVFSDPYITWLSIGQLQFGKGAHFKKIEGVLGKGLNHHMGYRKGRPASLETRRRFFNVCGWAPGMYPSHYLSSVKTWINDNVIKKILTGKAYPNVVPLFSPGYYDPNTLALDDATRKVIMGYFFALADKTKIQRQTQFIMSRWKVKMQRHIPLQYEYAKPAMRRHIREQIRSAEDKVDFKERLRMVDHWDKINARKAIPKKYLDEIDEMFIDEDINEND